MPTLAVTDLKAQLSEQLRHVKRGEQIIITERGVPIARIVPIEGETRWDADLRTLLEAGQLRPGTASLLPGFWDMAIPDDPDGQTRRALQAEREEGW